MRLIRTVATWFDQRLPAHGARLMRRDQWLHPIPRETASWAYVFRQRGDDGFLGCNG